LEAAIGTELFERHSRGITLTAAGHALEKHAQRILNDVDLLCQSQVQMSDDQLFRNVRFWGLCWSRFRSLFVRFAGHSA
jgi:DNA-binding transcriptional LysR family regulator